MKGEWMGRINEVICRFQEYRRYQGNLWMGRWEWSRREANGGDTQGNSRNRSSNSEIEDASLDQVLGSSMLWEMILFGGAKLTKFIIHQP